LPPNKEGPTIFEEEIKEESVKSQTLIYPNPKLLNPNLEGKNGNPIKA